MPPRTRAAKTTKNLKENIDVGGKSTLKTDGKVIKGSRKVLGDKTNSASDDNASLEVPKKVSKKPPSNAMDTKLELEIDSINKIRPRRDRRLPNRFVENHVLKNLFISKETSVSPNSKHTPAPISYVSPLKTPQKVTNTSLVSQRPRRICRLPSRLEDHAVMSPNKFIPVQPTHASTPIVQKKLEFSKTVKKNAGLNKSMNGAANAQLKQMTVTSNKPTVVKKTVNKTSPDTNNNAKQGKTLRDREVTRAKTTSKDKKVIPRSSNGNTAKMPSNKNFSFRVLEDKKQSLKEDNNKLDIYEFTYNPDEEPPPQKKKRKRVVRKKPAKPKSVVFKSIYDENLSKALNALKKVVAKKPIQTQVNATKTIQQNNASNATNPDTNLVKQRNVLNTDGQHHTTDTIPQQNNAFNATNTNTNADTVKPTNGIVKNTKDNDSVQVEDIAANFDPTIDHHEFNYSPVNSPDHRLTPTQSNDQSREKSAVCDDPLNLRDDISFFDEPVASSSMNTSRHPLASPWRVEFQDLHIKWHVNSYVKPNMTPAVESSFINFDDNKKKHVYTNMVPEINAPPEIVENNESNLKQPSIISFMREVVEKSASKKKKGNATKITKTNYIFDDITKTVDNTNTQNINKTAKNKESPQKSSDSIVTPENNKQIKNVSNDTDSSRESLKRKNDSNPCLVPAKTPRKEKDKTYFGFDDSEEEDQENMPPNKNARKLRALRRQAVAVLKEKNQLPRPTRAEIPLAPKSKALYSEVMDKLEVMKSATDAPEIPDKVCIENTEPPIVTASSEQEEVLDEEVHLFEDIEMVHHLKPSRKSYGKAKKVTFPRNSDSDSDAQDREVLREEHVSSGDEDDLDDLTFEVPTVKQKKTAKKKQTKKQKLSKKEAKEAEAWAVGFNSMCEDIDEFTLVFE